MEGSKLKNLVLMLLVAVNLSLLTMVAYQEYQNTKNEQETRLTAIQFLVDKGLSVTQEQVPKKMTLKPQVMERNLEQEGTLAAQLLKGPVQVQARGGEIYRYFNENGSIQMHKDGTFSAQLTPGVFPVGENQEADCRDILAQLEFQGELVEQEGNRLTFRQVWEQSPVYNEQVTLEVTDGCLTAMTDGRHLVGQPEQDTARSTITVATALIELLNGINSMGDVCSYVDTITQGYVSSSSLSAPMTLTPVWNVVTDTGAYRLDTVTGVLTRVS